MALEKLDKKDSIETFHLKHFQYIIIPFNCLPNYCKS